MTRYNDYTARVDYTVTNEESNEKCRSSIALPHSSIKQIKNSREKLQVLCTEIRDEYRNCNKKDIMLGIEQIEDELLLQIALAQANDLCYKLTARLDETRSVRDRMEIKLGYASHRSLRMEKVDLEDTASPSNQHNSDQYGEIAGTTTNLENGDN